MSEPLQPSDEKIIDQIIQSAEHAYWEVCADGIINRLLSEDTLSLEDRITDLEIDIRTVKMERDAARAQLASVRDSLAKVIEMRNTAWVERDTAWAKYDAEHVMWRSDMSRLRLASMVLVCVLVFALWGAR